MWQNACPWDYGYGGWNWLWFGYQLFWLLLIVGGGYLMYRLIKSSQSGGNNRAYGHFQSGSCPGCKAPVEADFMRCPECGFRLKRNCPQCGKIIKTHWQICPYCEADIETSGIIKK